MKNVTACFAILLAMVCVSDVLSDECQDLANRYGANVIEVTDFVTGKREVYASLRDRRLVWKSSGRDQTRPVQAATIREARKQCADLMRPGVAKNPNPPSPDPDWP
jgi:hypothetical protein